jgi:hypothetical protein
MRISLHLLSSIFIESFVYIIFLWLRYIQKNHESELVGIQIMRFQNKDNQNLDITYFAKRMSCYHFILILKFAKTRNQNL